MLAKSPRRSGSSTLLSLFGLLGLFAILWAAAATILMITVGVLHSWWPLVPTMPFTVAIVLAGIQVLAAGIGGIINETWKAAFR